jgi:hypothetical protein
MSKHASHFKLLPPLIQSLPGWAAHTLSERFESYDALRLQANPEEQSLLPANYEEFFRDVFSAFEDARDAKVTLLRKSEEFVRDASFVMVECMMAGSGEDGVRDGEVGRIGSSDANFRSRKRKHGPQ